MNWNSEELSNYVSHFADQQREYVLKEIFESELLQKYLGTTEGRLILNNVVDSIRDYTMQIVSLSAGDFEKNADKIKQAALQINMAYKFMYQIAGTVQKGEEHSKNIKK